MLQRTGKTDSVDIYEEMIESVNLEDVRPHDWMYGVGNLSIEAAGVLNQLGRHGFRLQKVTNEETCSQS